MGTYTVPVMLDIMADGDIGISGTYQVQVRISERAEASENTDPTEAPNTAAEAAEVTEE